MIILDEPTLGIDPTGVKDLLGLIVQLSREEGLTVLFSSHDLHHVQQVCDRVGLFVSGKLLAEGNIQSLAKQLFTQSPFLIEVGLSPAKPDSTEASGTVYSIDWLKEQLKRVEGINSIEGKGEIFSNCLHT